MIFTSPKWVPEVRAEEAESIPVGQFVLSKTTLPTPPGSAPFVDAVSGESYSSQALAEKTEWLARALAREFGWAPNTGSPWDKVVGIYSLNTIDYFVVLWAIHRLGGTCLPLHSTSTVAELTSHMGKSRCKAIFTCQGLETACIEATEKLSIPLNNIYTLPLPKGYVDGSEDSELNATFKSVAWLLEEGQKLEPLEPLVWRKGQAKTQVAFLCPTSGTSGKQKLAKLTHYGISMNTLQTTAHDNFAKQGRREIASGAIPFSHSYGLLVGHLTVWRGDSLVVFPRFNMEMMLGCTPKYRVNRLYLVPAILAAMAANPFLFELFDLSSVTNVVTGGAALKKHLADKLLVLRPGWKFLQAYGSTETSILATFTSEHDVWHGSSGSLLPSCQLRLVTPEGLDISGYDQVGEILYKAPNIFVDYLGDEEASKDTFTADGWLRTGDVGVMRVSPGGAEHLVIKDRIKDMIKVKVVPADIESVLALHPAVVEAAVIGVPDDLAGERPQAFVVRSASMMVEMNEEDLIDSIEELIESELHETHWLHGRVVVISEIPKSQNGKVLKRNLRPMTVVA